MEEFKIRLNNFLFNSGVLGFYKILQQAGKESLMQKENNVLTIKSEALNGFENDYIQEMLHEFRKDTRWYSIIQSKEKIETLDLETKEGAEVFKISFDFLKKALESASYKSGYEIVSLDSNETNPYQILEMAKKENDISRKRELWFELEKYLEENEEVYCMKDIIYNKINVFWENVAFLNKNSNKSRIKEEYKKSFVDSAINYLNTKQKSEYNCIECGSTLSKSDASSMSWVKDVGVDINRKKSGFWNFKEDTFLCPICNLIYSCIPLGFYLIGSNGIFINCNSSIEMLLLHNNNIRMLDNIERDTMSHAEHRLFYQLLEQSEQKANEEICKDEPDNIQVVKRIATDRDNLKYKFNTISKEKLQIFAKTKENFDKLRDKFISFSEDKGEKGKTIDIYEQVLSNFLENRKQYKLLDIITSYGANHNFNMSYAMNIIKIQLYCIGGINMSQMKEEIEEIRKAGETLQKFYYVSDENENKLKAYIMKLTNSLRTNNVTAFMDVVTRMYGSLGKGIPAVQAFERMLKEEENFRILGYAYVIGLEGFVTKKEIEGGKENEE